MKLDALQIVHLLSYLHYLLSGLWTTAISNKKCTPPT